MLEEKTLEWKYEKLFQTTQMCRSQKVLNGMLRV